MAPKPKAGPRRKPTPKPKTAPKINAKATPGAPMGGKPIKPLSPRERDRRWERTRTMMREQGVECLLVFGSDREQVDNYLTNDLPGSTVIFPLEGAPVAITRGHLVGTQIESALRGEAVWIDDFRFRPGPATIVNILKEKGCERGRIGVVGAEGGSHFFPTGWTPYATWKAIREALPHAALKDVSWPFMTMTLVRSEEELALFRRAAAVSELACQVMLDVVKPGVGEAEVFAVATYEILRHGARARFMILHSGPDNPSWHYPKWQMRAQPPRVIRRGDIIVAELFPEYGFIEAQAQMCIAVGKVAEVNRRCAEIARRSYEIGLKALRPGRPFGEVAEAMEGPLREAGAWHLTPLIHSMNPLILVGPVTVGIHKLPGADRYKDLFEHPADGADVVLEPGMTIQLEPNACMGKHRINIGGNAIVTATGAEELNRIPTEMRRI